MMLKPKPYLKLFKGVLMVQVGSSERWTTLQPQCSTTPQPFSQHQTGEQDNEGSPFSIKWSKATEDYPSA